MNIILLPEQITEFLQGQKKIINGQNLVERGIVKCLNACFYLISRAINSSQGREYFIKAPYLKADISIFMSISWTLRSHYMLGDNIYNQKDI